MSLNVTIKWALRLFGIIIFIFLLVTRVNLTETLKMLPNIALKDFFAAILFLLFLLLLKAWRWQILLRMQGIYFSRKKSFLIYMAGLFVGVMTPGRVGDFVKIFYLKNEGYSWGKSSFSVLLDRLIVIGFLLCCGYISLLFFIRFFATQLAILSLTILLGLLVTYLFVRKRKTLVGLIEKFISKLMPQRTKDGLKESLSDFYEDFKLLNTTFCIILTAITLLDWSIYFMIAYFLSQSLSLGLSFLVISACVSISAIITLIPISVAGIGTRDATLVFLFSILGLRPESAIAFSMLLLFTYNILTGFIGLVAWLLCPFKMPVGWGNKIKGH